MSEWDRFDRRLCETVGDLPPGDVTVKSVTPWSGCMDQIILGLILSSFTLNFLWLQYLLPAVAVANLYLAFRTLRKSNRFFNVCWWLSGLKAGLFGLGVLLEATPLSGHPAADLLLGWPDAVMTFLLYFFFRLGLRKAARDVGQTPASDPMRWALLWYGVLLLLAVYAPDAGWLAFIPMVAFFIVVVKLLTEVGDDLDTWGYQVKAAPVRMSSHIWRRWFYLSLLGAVVALALCAHRIPLPAQTVMAQADSTAVSLIRKTLSEQGFPPQLLAQLPGEEITQLATAQNCVVRREEAPEDANDHAVDMTAVFVKVDEFRVRTYTFFSIDNRTTAFWRNGFRLLTHEDSRLLDCAGALYYRRGETQFVSALPLETQRDSGTTFFAQHYEQDTVTARFSYPLFARERQGYVAYTIENPPDLVYFSSLNFYQDRFFFQLPYRDVIRSGMFTSAAQCYAVSTYNPKTGLPDN